MRRRRPIQRILLVFAVMSYMAAAGCAIAAFVKNTGSFDPIVASLMATVVFFIGAGVVLHVIATADLPDLKIEKQ